jgi:hypothetical protein
MPYKRAKSRAKKKSFNNYYLIPIGFGLIFVISFWQHIFNVMSFSARFTWAVISAFLDRPMPSIPFDNLNSVLPLALNCVLGFALVMGFWLFLVSSQAILPVMGIRDVYRGAFHLFLHMIKRHGQAVFIDDGIKLATLDELDKPGQGVVVVDFNSAVALEEKVATPNILLKITDRLLLFFRLIDHYQSPRINGPGLIFTRRNERIREAVDLREQFRMRRGVLAYTRDGIEMVMNVNSAFTIGQEPDCLDVIYAGEAREENLRIVHLRMLPSGRIKVTRISNDLDEADRFEIHQYARVAYRLGHLVPFHQLPDPRALPVFNQDRVFRAVFSQARDNEDQLVPWYDLPVKVATDVTLDEFLKINYDDLYPREFINVNPLRRLRSTIHMRMRNLGLLNYRLLARFEGGKIKEGDELSPEELFCSPVRSLQNSKVLRDRGIKVLAGGIQELRPASEAVYRQHLETWRARWESDVETIRATRDLEASRIRSRERAITQSQMVATLSRIFDSQEYSQEVMAIRILQALEQIAADPKTRQLLPGDTLRVLGMVRDWLLPGDLRSGSMRSPMFPPGEEGGGK